MRAHTETDSQVDCGQLHSGKFTGVSLIVRSGAYSSNYFPHQMSSIPDLVVTAPHSQCDMLAPNRACDLAAALAGQSLCLAMQKQNLSCVYLPGDEFRRDHDLNRKPSRSTKYRKGLESVMKGVSSVRPSSGHTPLLLDVHSFPDYYMEEAGDINFFAKGEKAPDIVLLQGPKNMYNEASLTDVLFHSLSRAGLQTKIIKGILVNDIMNQANEYGISGILLEFNEKYNKEPEKLRRICETIVKTIVRIRNK